MIKNNKTTKELIIDVDCGKTTEDDLALCYAFAEKSLHVDAVTLAPYKDRIVDRENAQLENELEIHRLFRYIGFKNYDNCYRGGKGFCDELNFEKSPAVDKIISLAVKNKITIVCLGSLTNVAVAISNKPNISKNLDILWLGLRHVFHDEFSDLNYTTDKKAFEIVAKSDANLTIFPSYIGKLFSVSYNKMKEDICINHLGNYLYRRLTEKIDYNQEFCRLYSLTPIAYLINPDFCYIKKLPVNMLFKDFPKTSMNKLVNYIYDLKSIESIWKDFSKKIEKLSNNFAPVNYFFTSDTHLNDGRKYKLRQFGFKTKEEMADTIIKNWNSVVSSKDIVYHLGDFGDYDLVKKLHGKIYLICGNHDIDYMNKNALSFDEFREKLKSLGFADVYKDGVMLDKKVFGRDIYMNHFPSKTKPGIVNFFGHVHSLKPLKKMGVNVASNYHKSTPISKNDMVYFIDFVTDTECDGDALS